ncbi:MAG TPA: ATP-binding protein, partial [Bacillales bacterium]|nr:ATP-binding protein [Bacillales bacterium]
LKEGLEELLGEFESKQPLDIQWEIADVPKLAKGIEDHLFRIVQEGMSNVFRHSQATSVTIRLGTAGGQLYLRIIDNGIGFNMEHSKPSSYGLQSIQERANEIGGVADIISFPGKGTQIEVKVPIVEKGREKES